MSKKEAILSVHETDPTLGGLALAAEVNRRHGMNVTAGYCSQILGAEGLRKKKPVKVTAIPSSNGNVLDLYRPDKLDQAIGEMTHQRNKLEADIQQIDQTIDKLKRIKAIL